MSGSLTYPEAIVVGALQGVTELFPVSSLGHSILIPALLGGRWAADLSVSAPHSPYLAFIVGLHVATAAALLVFFWRDWLRIATGFGSSVRHRRVRTPDERLAWIIIVGTIPVGLAGLALDHVFRTVLGRPAPAAIFLTINGLILYGAERLRRRAEVGIPALAVAAPSVGAGGAAGGVSGADAVGALGIVPGLEPGGRSAGDTLPDLGILTGSGSLSEAGTPPDTAAAGADRLPLVRSAGDAGGTGDDERAAAGADGQDADVAADRRIAGRPIRETTLIAAAQILALLPGISRSGVTMAAGLLRGLSHDDAARLSFLLATPVILAAGVFKIPELFGPDGAGIGGQVLVGSLASGIGAYLAVRFLTRYFQTRTLTPFAIYCTVAGLLSLVVLAVR